ncbi:MAG TPA: hypothetical protein VFY95_10100 [Sphingomicrobium sp.]
MIVALISSLEKALLASTVVGSIWVAVSERWRNRTREGFWVVVAIFFIVNVIAIWAIPISRSFRAGLLVAYPLGMAEGFLLWWLLGQLKVPSRHE